MQARLGLTNAGVSVLLATVAAAVYLAGCRAGCRSSHPILLDFLPLWSNVPGVSCVTTKIIGDHVYRALALKSDWNADAELASSRPAYVIGRSYVTFH